MSWINLSQFAAFLKRLIHKVTDDPEGIKADLTAGLAAWEQARAYTPKGMVKDVDKLAAAVKKLLDAWDTVTP